jgi:hypothetical protein
LFGDRGVRDKRLCRDSDGAGEVFVAGVDALQHGCCEEHLERAAHRESFVWTMACFFACACVEDGDAESAVVGMLQLRQQGREISEALKSLSAKCVGEG